MYKRQSLLHVDAHLRDFTVNALYFCPDSRRVVDGTGRGLADLRQRLLRTPLSPAATLGADPLRALRALRLAASLSFALDPGLWRALASPALRDDLSRRVSPQRVGAEVRKGLHGPHAARFAELLVESRLCEAAFPPQLPWRKRAEAHGLAALRLAAAAVPGAAWHQLAQAFVAPQLQEMGAAQREAFLEGLQAWGYGREVSRGLERLGGMQSALPALPMEEGAQAKAAEWMLEAGEEHWRVGLCVACAEEGRAAAVEEVVRHFEERLVRYFRVGPSLNGKELLERYEALRARPELLNPILKELRILELHHDLAGKELSPELRDEFIQVLINEPFSIL